MRRRGVDCKQRRVCLVDVFGASSVVLLFFGGVLRTTSLELLVPHLFITKPCSSFRFLTRGAPLSGVAPQRRPAGLHGLQDQSRHGGDCAVVMSNVE